MTDRLKSVVVPAFDAEATLESTIGSVLAQTDPGFELIIVDDGSTDRTAEIAAEAVAADSRVHLVQQENAGVSAARNAGIEASTGSLISFLDSDDLYLPTYLERMSQVLESDPDAAFAFTDAYLFDYEDRRFRSETAMSPLLPPLPLPESAELQLRLLLERNFIFTATMVRRDALARAGGGFDLRQVVSEDYALWVRLIAEAGPARYAGEPLAVRRQRPGSLSRDLARLRAAERQLLDLLDQELELSPECRRILARRVENLDRGPNRAKIMLKRLRGGLRTRLRPESVWMQSPPESVDRAFGDLFPPPDR